MFLLIRGERTIMRLINYFIGLLSIFAIVAAAKREDKKKTTSPTPVWITVTKGGVVTKISTDYKQSFLPTHASANDDFKSGGIGLGSQTGTVGKIRSYKETTIGQSNAAAGLVNSENIYSGIAGISFLLFGALL